MNTLVKAVILLFLSSILVFGTAYSTPPAVDPASFETASYGFQSFFQYIAPFVEKVVASSAITDFSFTLWKFFAVVLLVWEMAIAALSGFDFSKLFATIFIIVVVRILMLNYDQLTAALWSWSEGLATSIQTSAVGADDEFFAPRYLWNLLTSISWDSSNFAFHMQSVLAELFLGLLSALLCIASFFASIWALWGYSIAKMIGLTFLPLLLFKRLSWLFDGWLRFFFGFLVYNVLAKAMLMLVIFAVSSYWKLSPNSIPQNNGYHLSIHDFTDILGLTVFVLSSLVGLVFTGGFVKTLVSGAEVGSLQDGLKSLQNLWQKTLRGLA